MRTSHRVVANGRALLAALAIAGAACNAAVADAPEQRAIDAGKSSATFSVTHIFVEHVTGRVPIASGTLTFAGDSLIPASATAVIDATKIKTDEPDRDGALESPDFFDAKKYPTWTFASTKITPHGAAAFDMDGTLTIHGVTQPEHLRVTITGGADHPLYHATGQIDRHAFGMTITRLDPVIGATVDVALDIALQ